ncbi:MAG: DEAD/DEAH box helicase family protein [Candidatus Contendobacter sp.]
MSAPTPKRYQRDAVNNVLDIFRHAESQMQAAADEDSHRAASAFNGCVLLEAPTGAGKTLMAGLIAEAFARPDHPHNARIVWFWFTPFSTLVEQAKGALKRDFPGLRVRDLASERVAYSAQSGDVFVTTWASVAARNADTRKLRTSGDLSLALDEFIPGLRQADFRIGVVVDEAHHGFTSANATEAVRFYRDVMRPDFTLLITATPNDADVEKFRKAAGIGELHRHRVSRKDAVDAGLIKEGVQCIAYLAQNDQSTLSDIPATALAEGWHTHNAIKKQLAEMGINLTPLMLVQVGNKGNAGTSAIQDAKTRLLELGVPEDVIAWYTADEPNDDLLAVALDESKEVLLFKMAVALGFDAPRAFTVVSMRGAKDTDFGVQVVGRILRVHRRLQSKVLDQSLPALLRCGYVFLAEAESQGGLIGAGEKINAIQTELSGISPYTMLVRIAGEPQIQVIKNGQPALLPQPYAPPVWKPADGGESESTATLMRDPSVLGVTPIFPDFIPHLPDVPLGQNRSEPRQSTTPSPGNVLHPLRAKVPTQFQTERLPFSTDELLKGIGAHLKLNAEVLNAGLRKSVKITRKTITDIFGHHDEVVDTVQAKLSRVQLARRAQRVLTDAQYYHPRDLEEMLLSRLRLEYNDHQGIGLSDEELRYALDLILANYPKLVRDAARASAALNKKTMETAHLPEHLEMAAGAQRSRLNVYGVMPPDLNEHERKFAELLDADTSGTALWWHRNEPRKPWSIGIVLPDGDRYFPDFAVGVKDRTRGGGVLLLETKGGHLLNSDETLEKVVATHKTYGPPVMLKRRDDGSFWIVRYIESRNRIEEDQAFRVENMAQY